MYCYAECRYAECRYAECNGALEVDFTSVGSIKVQKYSTRMEESESQI
jgi:hypothetical protein